MTTTKSGFVVRFPDGDQPLYVCRGSVLFGPADDYHMGDSPNAAALFASSDRAREVARATIARAHWGKVAVLAAERTTTTFEVVRGLGEDRP